MAELWPFVGHVGAALLMGIAIGLERQYRQHPAGLRTNALVCVGSALFVSVSRLVENNSTPTQVAAQVASGIGFLGGGVILREGLSVRGMNTAATLWCSAAVGVLSGMGFALEAAVGTATVLFVHLALRPVVRLIDARVKISVNVETTYRLRVECEERQEGVIRMILLRHINEHPQMSLQGIARQDSGSPDRAAVIGDIFSVVRNDKFMDDLVSRVSIEPSVSAVSWQRLNN